MNLATGDLVEQIAYHSRAMDPKRRGYGVVTYAAPDFDAYIVRFGEKSTMARAEALRLVSVVDILADLAG